MANGEQFHGKMRSRTPSKPGLIATFLLRFHLLLPLYSVPALTLQ
jgi:hypothetical protein